MDNKLVLIICCVLLPPLGVLLKKGISMALLLSIILTVFFWIPGVIYALWVCLKD